MDNLRERVQTALNKNPVTQEAAIEVLNNNGIITLGGIVTHQKTSAAAESITKDVEGVVSVINEIQVKDDADKDNPFDVSGTLDEDIIVK